MTKILLIDTNSVKEWKELCRKEISRITPPGVEIDHIFPEDWSTPVSGYYAEALAVPHMLKAAKAAVAKCNYDVAVINCHCDPGLNPLREALAIPVIGPGEVSMALASYLGEKFAIISVGRNNLLLRRTARPMGVHPKFSSRIVLPSAVIDMMFIKHVLTREQLKQSILKECTKAIVDDEVDVVILAGTAFSFLNLVSEVRQELKDEGFNGIVIDALQTAFHFAKAITEMGLSIYTFPTRQ